MRSTQLAATSVADRRQNAPATFCGRNRTKRERALTPSDPLSGLTIVAPIAL